ncbi:hypothetical protein [uncultured Brachyspira sp.]|uniref:hypothetical protein n=1 Tax=uncultured Brachyspira sp. TaxID=221953 RepID=UPI002602C2DB|nr:hypothetical protein [uncultured Brachyspira sp.]
MSDMKKQDFKVNREIKSKIKKELNIGNGYDFIFNFYNDKVRKNIKNSYLAHYIRSLEQQLKEYTDNPFFSIIVKPLPINSKNLNVSVGNYYPKRYVTIYYHPLMDEIQLRDCLAHEIGHIFICTLLSNKIKVDHKKYNNTEPLASLIGILFMIDINDFYKNRCKEYAKRDYEEIIQNFLHINDRKKQLNN